MHPGPRTPDGSRRRGPAPRFPLGARAVGRPLAAAAMIACVVAAPLALQSTPKARRSNTPDDPALRLVLAHVADYLRLYERALQSFVAEEHYEQTLSTERRPRVLRSDYLVVANPAVGWYGFRDVFEVDGKPVRDHDDRIARLFITPKGDAMDQARRLSEESARYNLNPRTGGVSRTINSPYTVLRFLRSDAIPRSVFTWQPDDNGAAVVAFEEREKPRMIRSPDDAPARGTVTADRETGAIQATTLEMTTQRVVATIHVTYAWDERLQLLVPSEMTERYVLNGAPLRIEGRATYGKYRRFDVTTETAIEK